jgi:FkbM family methyltransferase
MKKTIEYRHGKVSYLENDDYIGRALSLYGEREEEEVSFLLSLVKDGDTVVDVGANIGMLTVPLAKKARVLAFEPQPKMFELLKENVEQNGTTAEIFQLGLGEVFGKAGLPPLDYDREDNFGGVALVPGNDVKIATLDSFNLEKCHLIKIDVEGMEADVLRGAKQTIERHRPLIYVENTGIGDRSPILIGLLAEFGYEMYWHASYLFNPDNWSGVKENIFPNTVSVMMFCIPRGTTHPATKGLRRVTSLYDRENGQATVPAAVRPQNGWAGVVRRGGIGDNLMAASAVGALKRKGLKVEVITTDKAIWQVFLHNPNVDKLSVKSAGFDIPPLGTLEWQKWHKGRSEEFDVFANLHHSCEGTLAFFTASTQFHWPAYVRRRMANKNYLELVHDIAGCGYDFGPLFYSSDEERAKALETKAKVGDRCIGLVMSGSRIDKLHPRLPGIVARLISELNVPVVLLGDEGQYENAKLIEKHVIGANGSIRKLHIAISTVKNEHGHRAIDWPVRRSLSFALVCDLVIGPDTGMMWGVAMEQMPKIVLLGHASPTNITKHWINTITLHADQSVPCWPCHQLHDDPPMPIPGFHSFCTPNADGSGAACISSISVETIIAHAKTFPWQQPQEIAHVRRQAAGVRQADD